MNFAEREGDDESPEQLEDHVAMACHDINSALAAVNLCIDFLAERTGDLGHAAVQDAHVAVRRIAESLAELHVHARQADTQRRGSALVKCAAPSGEVSRSTRRPDSTAERSR
jgi:hypothetical protein